jgi:hypothetical protein
MIGNAFVEQLFGQSLSLRRSRSDIASIAAARGPRQLHPDNFLERVRNATLVEAGIPSNKHHFAQVDIMAHHGVKSGIRRAMFQAIVNIGCKLGLSQPLDVQHSYVRHELAPPVRFSNLVLPLSAKILLVEALVVDTPILVVASMRIPFLPIPIIPAGRQHVVDISKLSPP